MAKKNKASDKTDAEIDSSVQEIIEPEEDIEENCKHAINAFEPRARALNVTAIAKPDRNSISVTVEFRIINSDEFVRFNTTLARLR